MQNLKKNWLAVSKLTLGIWLILIRALKSLKRLYFNGFLLSKAEKCMRVEYTDELYVMTIKNIAKFEEKSACRFKIDIRNLTNSDRGTRKSQEMAL